MTMEETYRNERNENSRRIIRRHICEMQSMICKSACNDIDLRHTTLTADDCKLMGEFVTVCEKLESLADQIYGPYKESKENES